MIRPIDAEIAARAEAWVVYSTGRRVRVSEPVSGDGTAIGYYTIGGSPSEKLVVYDPGEGKPQTPIRVPYAKAVEL